MYILHAVCMTDSFSRELFVINYLFRTNWNAAARATVELVALHFFIFSFPMLFAYLYCGNSRRYVFYNLLTISNYCHH